MTDQIMQAHTRATAALRARVDRLADERGDVPGWVLITLMTAALVSGLWAVAGERLTAMFQEALANVGPGGQ